MDKSNPPTTFGVFKPVGHVVVALESAAVAQAVSAQLFAQGFSMEDVVHYTPAEMKAQVDAQVATASAMASVGQDLNLILAHRKLAESGCSFLVVHAPEAEQVDRIGVIANAVHAKSAQRYGMLVVEELMQTEPGQHQTFESPDKGLDVDSAQVRSS